MPTPASNPKPTAIPRCPELANKPKPDFEKLRAARNSAVQEVIDKVAAKLGGKPGDPVTHTFNFHTCYCACPDGPCEHTWGGWLEMENGGTQYCLRCKMTAIHHSIMCGP